MRSRRSLMLIEAIENLGHTGVELIWTRADNPGEHLARGGKTGSNVVYAFRSNYQIAWQVLSTSANRSIEKLKQLEAAR